MTQRLKSSYEIGIACSDHYDVYDKYRITRKHSITKAETSLVESFNSFTSSLLG